MLRVFIAYASTLKAVGETIERAKQNAAQIKDGPQINTWVRDDLGGQQLADPILEAIEESDIIVTDITSLNFNVTYELGYALGRGKRVLPVRNSSFEFDTLTTQLVGVYDTVTYQTYATAEDLLSMICAAKAGRRFATDYQADPLPTYVVLPPVKDDDANDIVSLLPKLGLRPRTFDPSERPRLGATDAIKGVAASSGVVVPILAKEKKDEMLHNLRAAFVIGVSQALGRPTLILQRGAWPAPLDIRDDTAPYNDSLQLRKVINEFAAEVHDYRYTTRLPAAAPANKLALLNLGDPAAENEESVLDNYFLERDEFRQILDGRAQIVIGRKGSGKTAIFFQVRNTLRDDRSNVVVDLNPDAHQLSRLKEVILKALSLGSKEFLLAAFWEYVLLLEVTGKILEKDKEVHKRNHKLFEPYQRLLALFSDETAMAASSFSARLLRLIGRIGDRYAQIYQDKTGVDLSDGAITNLLYETTIAGLREQVTAYALEKGVIYVLFDNIDKGWNATGLHDEDVVIIRTLLEASRKLANDFRRAGADFKCAVFLRNDIYDVLLSNTSDRGKDTKALIDWVQPDLLKYLVGRRLQFSLEKKPSSTDALWSEVCVSLVDGENSLDYLIRHSLRRPRFLLSLINHCKGIAVNFGRSRIDEEDIANGLSLYSTDITTEIGLEMRDVLPECDQILYVFLGEPRELSRSDIYSLLARKLSSKDTIKAVFVLLLWHGVIGIKRDSGISYIYDVNYDLQKLLALVDKADTDALFEINPAFWPNFESTPVAVIPPASSR